MKQAWSELSSLDSLSKLFESCPSREINVFHNIKAESQ